MGLNIWYTIIATVAVLILVAFLEAKGINHKICDWILKSFKVVLPLKGALAIYANSVMYKSNPDYNQETFKRIFDNNNQSLVPKELFTLLQLAQDKKLSLYGRKSFSSPIVPLQSIPIDYLFKNKANWSDDYSTIYFDSKDVAYTDISIKRKELYSLINNR